MASSSGRGSTLKLRDTRVVPAIARAPKSNPSIGTLVVLPERVRPALRRAGI